MLENFFDPSAAAAHGRPCDGFFGTIAAVEAWTCTTGCDVPPIASDAKRPQLPPLGPVFFNPILLAEGRALYKLCGCRFFSSPGV